MTVKNIQDIARKIGLKVGKMKKADLVLSIQAAEGNTPPVFRREKQLPEDRITVCGEMTVTKPIRPAAENPTYSR